MRTTIRPDDELLAQAHEMTGVTRRSTLIHDGLRLLIQREAARRLLLLGGSDPTAEHCAVAPFPAGAAGTQTIDGRDGSATGAC